MNASQSAPAVDGGSAGASTPIPGGKLTSTLEVATRSKICGWAIENAAQSNRVVIRIMANGEVIGRVVADQYRVDLEKAGIGDGRHGFVFLPEPGQLELAARYEIEVVRDNDGYPLRGSPVVVEPAPVDTSAKVAAISAHAASAVTGPGIAVGGGGASSGPILDEAAVAGEDSVQPSSLPDGSRASTFDANAAAEAAAAFLEELGRGLRPGEPRASSSYPTVAWPEAADETDSQAAVESGDEPGPNAPDAGSDTKDPDISPASSGTAGAEAEIEPLLDEPPSASSEIVASPDKDEPVSEPPIGDAVEDFAAFLDELSQTSEAVRATAAQLAAANPPPAAATARGKSRRSRSRLKRGDSNPGGAVSSDTGYTEFSTVGLGHLGGNLDLVTRSTVSGWARNEVDPHLPVGLVVTSDGQVIARVLANRFRPDLQRAGIGDGNHGFELMFPELSPLRAHEVHVTREADGVELLGSPKIIPAANVFDADAEKGIAGILAALDEDSETTALDFLVRQADLLLTRRADREADRTARHLQYLFRRRWGKTAGSEAGWALKDEVLAPRALVVDDYVPDAGRDAGSIAILSHVRALKALGFEVALVAARDMNDPDAMEALRADAGIAVYGLPHYYTVEDVLKRNGGLFDVVYLHRISNAKKYMPLVRMYNSKARVVYSVADLHHVRLARQGEVEKLNPLLHLSGQVAFDEFTAARQSDAVITHSPYEAGLLGRRVPPGKVYVVPWAVAQRPRTTPFADRRGLAVIGHFEHKPNPDSVFWMLRYVMPLVWERDPSIRCAIVGHGWTAERLPRRDERIDLTGPVPDLQDVFNRIRVTVAPLRFGAGVKGKVLESFAAGIPCVMSPVAAEGIPLPPLLMELVAGSARLMADAILRFHSDEAANTAAAEAGMAMIAQENSEEVVTAAMAKVLPLAATAETELASAPDKAPAEAVGEAPRSQTVDAPLAQEVSETN